MKQKPFRLRAMLFISATALAVTALAVITLALSSCASSPAPSPQGAAAQNAAAQDAGSGAARAQAAQALGNMDDAFAGRPAQSAAGASATGASAIGGQSAAPANRTPSSGGQAAAPASQGVESSRGGSQPGWTNTAYDISFPESAYFAAAGEGQDRARAEQNAMANLVLLFGERFRADLRSMESYYEAVNSGRVSFSQNAAMETEISRSSQLDTLAGAEIRNVWDSGRGRVYARAVLERARARQLYGELAQANARLITDLTGISAARNTFEGYTAFTLAGTVADAFAVYARVLSMAGGTPPAGIRSGAEYRETARQILQSIRIGLVITGDRNGRIQAALNQAVSSAGFRTGSGGSYRLQVAVTLVPADEYNTPGAANVFCRYTLSADLVDTGSGSTIFNYGFTSREGHTSMAGAENRAVQMVERKLAGQDRDQQGFAQALQEFIASRTGN